MKSHTNTVLSNEHQKYNRAGNRQCRPVAPQTKPHAPNIYVRIMYNPGEMLKCDTKSITHRDEMPVAGNRSLGLTVE